VTRPGGKNTGPTPVGTLLRTSARLAARSDRIDPDRWRRIVGERVAQRTRPGSIRGGELTVHVASAVWAQELTFLSTALLEKLAAEGFSVKELRFRVGDVGEPAPKAAPAAPAAPPKAALPPELEERLRGIADPGLRAAIAEAAAYSLGRPEPATGARRASRSPRSVASGTGPPDRAPAPPPSAPKGTGGKRSR
jgi:hypothetical protein